MNMVIIMNNSKNKVNLDTNTKPLPRYKIMDNSMNDRIIKGRERINTNIKPPVFITDILPSITDTPSISPAFQSQSTQNFMYGMLSNIQKNTNCGSCGGSK